MGILSNDIDPRLQTLYDHWLQVRKGALIPNRRDIDPVAIWTVLPFVWMCDYIAESGRFRFRLAGEEMNMFHHRNLVGTYLDETFPEVQQDHVIAKYRRAIETPAILYVRGAIHAKTHPYLRGERLLLPLLDQSEAPTIIVGATVSHMGAGTGVRTGATGQKLDTPPTCETIEFPLYP